VLKVYLPAGFKDIIYSKYFQEQALIMTDDGFIDTMAVPPGRHDAVFTYAVKTEIPLLFRLSRKQACRQKN
jgi:hypothetical protein